MPPLRFHACCLDPATLEVPLSPASLDVRPPVDADDAVLVAGLAAAGYDREDQIVMTLTGVPDADRPDTTGVVELSVTERVDIAERVWQADSVEQDPAVRRELAERAHTAVAAADCTFLGVVGPDGVGEAASPISDR